MRSTSGLAMRRVWRLVQLTERSSPVRGSRTSSRSERTGSSESSVAAMPWLSSQVRLRCTRGCRACQEACWLSPPALTTTVQSAKSLRMRSVLAPVTVMASLARRIPFTATALAVIRPTPSTAIANTRGGVRRSGPRKAAALPRSGAGDAGVDMQRGADCPDRSAAGAVCSPAQGKLPLAGENAGNRCQNPVGKRQERTNPVSLQPRDSERRRLIQSAEKVSTDGPYGPGREHECPETHRRGLGKRSPPQDQSACRCPPQ